MIGSAPDDVRVFVASFNTHAATELTIRTLRATTGPSLDLVVGDGGSTDGSLAMLRRFERRGWLVVDRHAAARKHHEWLDHWVEACATRYAVFCDSDMIFRRSGWLDEMVDEAERSGAALVTAELAPAVARVVEPKDGKLVDIAERCSPWLLLVDCAKLRSIGASFAFATVEPEDPNDRVLVYDTGGRVWAAAGEAGLARAVMPSGFAAATYHHVGNLSWGRSMGMSRLRFARKMVRVYGSLWARRAGWRG